ncbi:MAG: hypothetical protein HFF72_11810 [Oscillospiraceae bacterium]|jgi:hypothetical protein|nr:hypothetical protein [Oscillospiraceae bacterium]MCI8721002.1 hypothetical protein [Oscillospiraceae bacterium]MCI8943793.1 hypothetical protein [Oscillospiraceae bacterium]
MPTFIGIESLAANALIELMDREQTREVSFDTLVRYGLEVVRVFGMRTGEEAVLLLSRQDQLDMMENYSEYFEVDVSDTYGGTFRLKDTASLEDLRKYFRWTMTVRLFEAFMSPEALQKLGVRI